MEKGGEGRAPRGGPVHVGYVHGCTSGVGFKLAVLGVPLISPGGVDGPWEQIVSTKRSFGCLDFRKGDWNRWGSIAGGAPTDTVEPMAATRWKAPSPRALIENVLSAQAPFFTLQVPMEFARKKQVT